MTLSILEAYQVSRKLQLDRPTVASRNWIWTNTISTLMKTDPLRSTPQPFRIFATLHLVQSWISLGKSGKRENELVCPCCPKIVSGPAHIQEINCEKSVPAKFGSYYTITT